VLNPDQVSLSLVCKNSCNPIHRCSATWLPLLLLASGPGTHNQSPIPAHLRCREARWVLFAGRALGHTGLAAGWLAGVCEHRIETTPERVVALALHLCRRLLFGARLSGAMPTRTATVL
jgi:hypothetical protein